MLETTKRDKKEGPEVFNTHDGKSAVSRPDSHRRRKLLPPAKPGTIKQSVIRKAIKELMEEWSTH